MHVFYIQCLTCPRPPSPTTTYMYVYTPFCHNFSLPEVPPPTLSVSSQALIKSILLVVGYLFRDSKRYLPDYRIALLKTATMARPREVRTSTCTCIVHEFQVLLAVWIINSTDALYTTASSLPLSHACAYNVHVYTMNN